VELLNEKKGENITIIDVDKISNIAKYIIIVSANSTVHSASLSGYVIDFFKSNNSGELLFTRSPDTNNPWILIDGTDYLINIFLGETRNFYSLEKLFHKGNIIFQS
jgi:ribosome-associated protein